MKPSQDCSNVIRLTVNGRPHAFTVGPAPAPVQPNHTLAHTLRETLGLTGTKVSCDKGACGCCTVLMDGEAVLSCMMLTVECGGKNITTVEGLADPVTGELDPLQQSFMEETAFQCGYCTPGILMSAKALLLRNPAPTEEDVKEALAGNYCRCITHYHVLDAVKKAVLLPGGVGGPDAAGRPHQEREEPFGTMNLAGTTVLALGNDFQRTGDRPARSDSPTPPTWTIAP